ncbi:MAG TPA: hypothetical protein VIJ25_08290, partial [Methylococcales bacterium]
EFTGIITIKHNYTVSGVYKPVIFKNAVDFVSNSNATLVLKYNGTSWYELFSIGNRSIGNMGGNLTATNNLVVTNNYHEVNISGTIKFISTSWATPGTIVYLRTIPATQIYHNASTPPSGYAPTYFPKGGTTITTTANCVYGFIYNGTYWYSLGESL